jgi:hypothetical protein
MDQETWIRDATWCIGDALKNFGDGKKKADGEKEADRDKEANKSSDVIRYSNGGRLATVQQHQWARSML